MGAGERSFAAAAGPAKICDKNRNGRGLFEGSAQGQAVDISELTSPSCLAFLPRFYVTLLTTISQPFSKRKSIVKFARKFKAQFKALGKKLREGKFAKFPRKIPEK